MADTALKEQAVWDPIIRQIETTDTVIGGEDGVPNIAPRQLANRTLYLKGKIEENLQKLNDHADDAKTPDPHPQYVTPEELGAEYATKTELYPIGAPIPWSSDILPENGEYAFMKGQAFDVAVYTELAKVFPNGVIDDMRGLAIVGKLDGEAVRAYEADNVKSHNHGASSSSTNLGTKYTNTTGNHRHPISVTRTNEGGSQSGQYVANGTANEAGMTWYTGYTGNHNHSVAIGAHSHTITVGYTGGSKNTIRNRKFNFIVRMA